MPKESFIQSIVIDAEEDVSQLVFIPEYMPGYENREVGKTVEAVECDNCGYMKGFWKFAGFESEIFLIPDVETELERLGTEFEGHLWAGCLCPECGNQSSFNLDPFRQDPDYFYPDRNF